MYRLIQGRKGGEVVQDKEDSDLCWESEVRGMLSRVNDDDGMLGTR